MPTFTIYVTGGGEYFYTTLNAVAMIFNDGSLIYTVIALGGMLALISGSWNIIQKNIGSGLIKSHTFIEHGLIMVVVAFLAFVPTRVTVQDIYGQQNATPIDNVPMLLSVPATMFSSIGYDAFRYIDTAFQSVAGSTMTVSENGFVTPLKLMMAVRGSLERVSPELYRSWVNFIGSCTRNSTVTTGGVLHSPDVARYLTTNAVDGGLVEIFLGRDAGGKVTALQNGQMMTCTEAKPMLNDGMSSLFDGGGSTNPMSAISRNVNMNMSESNRVNPNGQWDWTSIENAYNSFAAAVGSSAQSAQEFTKNALIRNAVVDGFRCGGNTLTATDQLLCTQAMNDAVQQYSIDAAGQGSWFSRMMLPTMTILQLLFFAFSVMAFLYGILRGAGVVTYLGKYMLFGAWVFSWLPFVAIINAFINWMVVDKMKSSATQGLTIENYDSYFMTMQDNLALASDLLAATPLITMALMTGSMYALSGVAQRMSSTDKIEEKNLAPSTADVGPVVKYGHEFEGDARTGLKTSATTLENVSVGDSLSTARESAMSRMEEANLQQANAFSQMLKAQSASGGSVRVTNSDGRSVNVSQEDMFETSLRKVREVGEGKGLSDDQIAAAEKATKLGLSWMGSGIGASGARKQAMSSTSDLAVRDAIAEGFGEASKYAERHGRDVASQITSESVTTNSEAKEAAAAYNESYAEAQKAAESFRRVDSLSQSIGTDLRMSVPQIAAKLAADTQLGTDGLDAARTINERYNALVNDPNNGATVESWTKAKVAEWRASGLSMQMDGETAQLLALNRFGDHEGFATTVGALAVTNDLSGIRPDRNTDIAAGVEGRTVQQGYDNLSAWTDKHIPDAAQGRASQRTLSELHETATSGDRPSNQTEAWVTRELESKLANTPAGTVLGNHASVDESLYRVAAVNHAQNNLQNPPQTAEEYGRLEGKLRELSAQLGQQLPRAMPADSLLDEIVNKNAKTEWYMNGGPLSSRSLEEFQQAERDKFEEIRRENQEWAAFTEVQPKSEPAPQPVVITNDAIPQPVTVTTEQTAERVAVTDNTAPQPVAVAGNSAPQPSASFADPVPQPFTGMSDPVPQSAAGGAELFPQQADNTGGPSAERERAAWQPSQPPQTNELDRPGTDKEPSRDDNAAPAMPRGR